MINFRSSPTILDSDSRRKQIYFRLIDIPPKHPVYLNVQYCRTAPKVYRYNYRIQLHSLAILSKEEIPALFKNPGLEDITDQYVVCKDIEVPLWKEKHPKEYVYLCCYYVIGWNPVCWSLAMKHTSDQNSSKRVPNGNYQ